MSSQFATIEWKQQKVQIEYRWLNDAPSTSTSAMADTTPLLVFLHEGLGSVSMWRDFPERLCKNLHLRGLVYSRPGYGLSTPRADYELWDVDFLHRQAKEVLPAFLQAVGVGAKQPLVLLGHSDGASIALLFAVTFPAQVQELIVLAPHIMVEDITIESIARSRENYLNTDLPNRLAKYHSSVDSAFWGWNRIWLKPEFRSWNIEREISAITAPILAVQGRNDEYGSLQQIEGIKALLPKNTELFILDECAHSPHRDQPEKLITACQAFLAKYA